jgi:hypothetical protein
MNYMMKQFDVVLEAPDWTGITSFIRPMPDGDSLETVQVLISAV